MSPRMMKSDGLFQSKILHNENAKRLFCACIKIMQKYKIKIKNTDTFP